MLLALAASSLLVGCMAMYPSSGDVFELNSANFERLVLQSDNIWIVEFYAPWCGHCQTLAPEYKKAAAQLKGVVKMGAVNVDEEKSLGGQYGIKGFPTIKIFSTNKKSPTEFSGARTAKGLIDAALAEIKRKVEGGSSSGGGGGGGSKGDVIELTDANFDQLVLNSDDVWLVEFFAPWCGHCKSLEPEWAKAASELRGKVKLGALDATVNQAKAQEYGVQGYPTIKFFAGGKKSASSAEDYQGGRTASDIVQFGLTKYEVQAPAPEVYELTSKTVFADACEKAPLTVVSILPHILDCDAKCRNNYIKVLKQAGEKYKQKLWCYVWAEAGAQSALEETLGMGGFGYPSMAIANLKKQKYSLLRGSFSKDGINEFLRDISYGRGQTAPIPGDVADLKIVQTVPWDGKDGQMPEEEDIDLSDVDLDDIKEEL